MLEEAGDLVLQSNVVNNLGIEAYYAGRWDEASALYRQSGALSERVGDVVNVARAQNNEGEIVSDQGELEDAEESCFLEARRVWRAARYPVGIASLPPTSAVLPPERVASTRRWSCSPTR